MSQPRVGAILQKFKALEKQQPGKDKPQRRSTVSNADEERRARALRPPCLTPHPRTQGTKRWGRSRNGTVASTPSRVASSRGCVSSYNTPRSPDAKSTGAGSPVSSEAPKRIGEIGKGRSVKDIMLGFEKQSQSRNTNASSPAQRAPEAPPSRVRDSFASAREAFLRPSGRRSRSPPKRLRRRSPGSCGGVVARRINHIASKSRSRSPTKSEAKQWKPYTKSSSGTASTTPSSATTRTTRLKSNSFSGGVSNPLIGPGFLVASRPKGDEKPATSASVGASPVSSGSTKSAPRPALNRDEKTPSPAKPDESPKRTPEHTPINTPLRTRPTAPVEVSALRTTPTTSPGAAVLGTSSSSLATVDTPATPATASWGRLKSDSTVAVRSSSIVMARGSRPNRTGPDGGETLSPGPAPLEMLNESTAGIRGSPTPANAEEADGEELPSAPPPPPPKIVPRSRSPSPAPAGAQRALPPPPAPPVVGERATASAADDKEDSKSSNEASTRQRDPSPAPERLPPAPASPLVAAQAADQQPPPILTPAPPIGDAEEDEGEDWVPPLQVPEPPRPTKAISSDEPQPTPGVADAATTPSTGQVSPSIDVDPPPPPPPPRSGRSPTRDSTPPQYQRDRSSSPPPPPPPGVSRPSFISHRMSQSEGSSSPSAKSEFRVRIHAAADTKKEARSYSTGGAGGRTSSGGKGSVGRPSPRKDRIRIAWKRDMRGSVVFETPSLAEILQPDSPDSKLQNILGGRSGLVRNRSSTATSFMTAQASVVGDKNAPEPTTFWRRTPVLRSAPAMGGVLGQDASEGEGSFMPIRLRECFSLIGEYTQASKKVLDVTADVLARENEALSAVVEMLSGDAYYRMLDSVICMTADVTQGNRKLKNDSGIDKLLREADARHEKMQREKRRERSQKQLREGKSNPLISLNGGGARDNVVQFEVAKVNMWNADSKRVLDFDVSAGKITIRKTDRTLTKKGVFSRSFSSLVSGKDSADSIDEATQSVARHDDKGLTVIDPDSFVSVTKVNNATVKISFASGRKGRSSRSSRTSHSSEFHGSPKEKVRGTIKAWKLKFKSNDVSARFVKMCNEHMAR